LAAFPFFTLTQALGIARLCTAVFFMAHAIVRIVKDTIPAFGAAMENFGFPNGVAVVWTITFVEIIAGLLLIFNLYVRLAASALFMIASVGIILIHARNGWFVGEHGTGGSEYSVALMVLLLVIACADRSHSRPKRPT
jgi:putative oxidoreductase